jgi:hypothetical protein
MDYVAGRRYLGAAKSSTVILGAVKLSSGCGEESMFASLQI